MDYVAEEAIVLWANVCVLVVLAEDSRARVIDLVEIDRRFWTAAAADIGWVRNCRTQRLWDFSDEDFLGVDSVAFL